MTAIALLTTAGLIGVVAAKNIAELRQLRLATMAVHPAQQPVDRTR